MNPLKLLFRSGSPRAPIISILLLVETIYIQATPPPGSGPSPKDFGELGSIGNYLGVWGNGVTGPDYENFHPITNPPYSDTTPYGDSLVHNLDDIPNDWFQPHQDTEENVFKALTESQSSKLGLGFSINEASFGQWSGNVADAFIINPTSLPNSEGELKLPGYQLELNPLYNGPLDIGFLTAKGGGNSSGGWTLFSFGLDSNNSMMLFFPPEAISGSSGNYNVPELSHLRLWSVSAVPETSTVLLGALSVVGAWIFRRRRSASIA